MRTGEVAEAVIDDKARRLLRLAREPAPSTTEPAPEQAIDRPEHRELMRRSPPPRWCCSRTTAPCSPSATTSAAYRAHRARTRSHFRWAAGAAPASNPITRRPSSMSLAAAMPGARAQPLPSGARRRRTPSLSIPTVAEYFDSAEFEGPAAFTQNRRRMEFRWLGTKHPGRAQAAFLSAGARRIPRRSHRQHRFTLTSAGLSSLLIDGQTAIDNWTNQRPGTAFYGRGSAEETADVMLTEGRSSPSCWSTSRPHAAARGAVGWLPAARTRRPDGACGRSRSRRRRRRRGGGLNADWETEGSDRVSLSLPGDQDELVRRVAAVNRRTVVVVNAGSPIAMPWAGRGLRNPARVVPRPGGR